MTSITGFPRNQRQNCFFLGLLVAASSFVSPPGACAVGLVFGLLFPDPFSKASQVVMASSVVGLGFGMDLHEGVRVGARGLSLTLGSASASLRSAGCGLGIFLRVQKTPAYLISVSRDRHRAEA
jgi:uncharacterized membrane protein YadS